MKFKEIAHLEPRELRQKIAQLRGELFNSRMKQKVQRLSDPLIVRRIRRDIARLKTALSQPSNEVKDESK